MASASSESDYASASSDIDRDCPTLVQLPEALVQEVLKWLDPLSLCLASQACVLLLRSASALRAPPQQQHYLVGAAKACLSSVLHLPPWALDCCLDFTHSVRFPLSLAMHRLRSSLAASDVHDIAYCTARAMQASLYHAAKVARARGGSVHLASIDPMLVFSSCRADRGFVRLSLRAPLVAHASLVHLRPAINRMGTAQPDGSLFPEGFNFHRLRTELLLCLGVDIRSGSMEKVPAGHTRSHAAVTECIRCYRRLLTDWQEVLAAAKAAVESLANCSAGPDSCLNCGLPCSLVGALWSAWATRTHVMQVAGEAEVQLLVSLEQAWFKGSLAAAAGNTADRWAGGQAWWVEGQQHEQGQGWAAALLAAGAAVSEHMKGSLGSLLGRLHAAPPSALAIVAALIRKNIAPQEAGQGQGVDHDGPDALAQSLVGSSVPDVRPSQHEVRTPAAPAVPLSMLLAGVGESHPRVALTALAQLAALGVMQEAAQQVLNAC